MPHARPLAEPAEAPPREQVARAKRLGLARLGVLVLLALALVIAYLTRHCLAVANTTMQLELGINNREFGLLYSAFSLGYLLFQVPGGWLGQRWGTRVTMPLLGILWSAATLLTALVTTLPALIATRFVFGLAQAGLIPNQAKVVNDWFPPSSRGTTSSVIVTAMSVGGVASMWLTARLMQFYDWRPVFQCYALVGVAWAVAFYALFRARPADVPGLNPEDTANTEGAGPSEPFHEPAAEQPPLAAPQLLACGSIWALAGQLFFKTAGYNLLVTFFPALLEYAYGTSSADAGAMASWPLIGVVFGSLLGGVLIDQVQQRTRSKRRSRCAVSAFALLLAAISMFATAGAATAHGWATAMTLAAFFSGIALPCTWAAVVDIGGSNSALAMGYVNIGSCLAGIAITPAIGHMIDYLRAIHGNLYLVILVHAVFYLAAALCWLLVDPEQAIDSVETCHAV